ncbi:MAG: hypothetical protein WBE80_09295 [Methylocella sp.]
MIVASDGHDILCPVYFAGVPANYLRRRVIDAGFDDAGLDPDRLRLRDSLGRGPGVRSQLTAEPRWAVKDMSTIMSSISLP